MHPLLGWVITVDHKPSYTLIVDLSVTYLHNDIDIGRSYCLGPGATAQARCPLGTYRTSTGGMYRADCVLCHPGTSATSEGATEPCPLCPVNSYCPTSTTAMACPYYTTSIAGSFSSFACVCSPGYACDYVKEVQVTVYLNCSQRDFDTDVGSVRTNLIAALAAAGGVDPTKVVAVVSHPAIGAGGRRLLGLSLATQASETEVRATVVGAVSVRGLAALSVVGYTWMPNHTLRGARH